MGTKIGLRCLIFKFSKKLHTSFNSPLFTWYTCICSMMCSTRLSKRRMYLIAKMSQNMRNYCWQTDYFVDRQTMTEKIGKNWRKSVAFMLKRGNHVILIKCLIINIFGFISHWKLLWSSEIKRTILRS